MDLDIHIKNFLCKLHVLRNFIRHLRELLSREKLNNTCFKEQLLRCTGFLESKLLAMIVHFNEEGGSETELKAALEVAVRHHFGRHNLCDANAKCQGPSNRQIVTDTTFDKLMSIANTSLLCFTSSLIENCDTNQVESFNNKQSEVTSGKRTNLSLSWAWIYRWALSVLAWNSSDQDAVALYLELAKDEELSEFHEAFNLTRARKRFQTADYERPDHTAGIRKFFKTGSLDPISYDPNFQHPYATGELSAQRTTPQRGPGYSSTGNADRDDLQEKELYLERDRVLRFLLRAHANRQDIAQRTVARHDSEEYVNIRSHIITSDKIFSICKFIEGSKETRVASWPNKLYTVFGSGAVRYSERFIHEENVKKDALHWLETHIGERVVPVGTLLHHEYPFLDGNPAGLLGEHKTVEIFYLYDQRSLPVIDAGRAIKWMTWNSTKQEFSINLASKQYAKIQGDLAAAHRESCLVVLATDVNKLTLNVSFDLEFWNQRLPILADFFYYGLYEQADPMKSRSQPPRIYSNIRDVCESDKWRTWP